MLSEAGGNVRDLINPLFLDSGASYLLNWDQDNTKSFSKNMLVGTSKSAWESKMWKRRVPNNARGLSDQFLKVLNVESIS